MGDINITFRRDDDDEEEEKRTPGRPNAWWAEHKHDVDEATDRAATFDSAVRGVSQGPHGGATSVRPEDTTGSLDYCWCGLPFDHDWPGKDRGRKHPREGSMSTAGATQQQHIERRQLRAYNDDLVDVIVEAVNGYHARYRMQKNGIVLFPPDGTTGITLNARASARQVKSARIWFLRHCVGVGDDGKPLNPLVADAAVLEEDHDKRLERVIEEGKADARAAVDELRSPDESSLSEPEAETAPAEEPWVPYVGSDGEENEFFETNGTILRCKVDGWETESARSIGGHVRTRHRDTAGLHSPEAREKATETKRLNKVTRTVQDAIEALSKSIGYAGPVDTKELEALQAENAALLKRAEEAEARLALMKEALGA